MINQLLGTKLFESHNLVYVYCLCPQNIFLSDQSIINNVAFGIPDELIDINRVIKCLEMVNLKSISKNLFDSFNYRNIGDFEFA